MTPETRAHSLTRTESLFLPQVPLEERQQSLAEIRRDDRPDPDTIAAVVSLLNDPDEGLRSMAAQMLRVWGQPAVTMILQALRATEPSDVPLRIALIEQLRSMGPSAARAETLLRSLYGDRDVGEAAQRAVSGIRLDGSDLLQRFLTTGGELVLLTAAVVAPMLAIRRAAPAAAMPPLGLSVGIGALVVVGLLMARMAFADDILSSKTEPDTKSPPGRWMIFAAMAVGGAVLGTLLGVLGWACGGMFQGWFN